MPDTPANPVGHPGRLEVICGPMFAGKTTELLRRLAEAHAGGQRVAAFKPILDRRYADAAIVSHAGVQSPARAVGTAAEILGLVRDEAVVGIDEAHFFGAPLAEACSSLLRRRTRVIVAGLERDHFGNPFEPFPALLCDADEVLKLSGPCAACGRPAIHSQRMVDTPGRIVVGGAEMYEARCRECFRPASSA